MGLVRVIPFETDPSVPRRFMSSEPSDTDLVGPCGGRPFSTSGELDRE
jgi:hypothetical protein